MGLMVVLASRKEMIPARSKHTPIIAIAAAEATRINDGTASEGAISETPHIAHPTINATAGGGTKSSSAPMLLVLKLNDNHQRRAPRIHWMGLLSD